MTNGNVGQASVRMLDEVLFLSGQVFFENRFMWRECALDQQSENR
jgi:hypothetical protein